MTVAVGSSPGSILGAAVLVAPPLAIVAPKMLTPLLCLTALLLVFLSRRVIEWRAVARAWLTWAFAAATLLGLASAAWAMAPEAAIRSALSTAGMFGAVLLAVAAARNLDAGGERRLLRLLLLGFAAGLALLAFELWSDFMIARLLRRWEESDRPIGDYVADRGMVLLLLLAFPLAVMLDRWRSHLLGVAALFPGLALSAFTNSQSARLAAVAGIIVLLLTWLFGRRVTAAFGVLTVLLALAMPLLPGGPLAPAAWEQRLHGIKYSALHRLLIWEFTSQRIAERPLLGWGFDASRRIPGGHDQLPQGGMRLPIHPHNAPLQLRLELGLPGALLLAGLLALAFRAVWQLAPGFPQAALTGLLVTGFGIAGLSFGVWQTWWISALGLTAALAVAAARPAMIALNGAPGMR